MLSGPYADKESTEQTSDAEYPRFTMCPTLRPPKGERSGLKDEPTP
jgi:hypothetical protein